MAAVITDAKSLDANSVLESTVCIIGAGPAGIALALEFEKKRIPCLLLESGSEKSDAKTQDLYSGQFSGEFPPLEKSYLTGMRLRMLGGSTNHWAGYCRPLDTFDLDARSWVPESGWPITYADLVPYYRQACPYVEIPELSFADVEKEWASPPDLPFKVNPDETADFRVTPFHFSKPTRFGQHYFKALDESKSIHLVKNANAVELIASSDGKRIDKVDCRTFPDKPFTARAKFVVVACGGIESTRLLLLSNKKHSAGIGNGGGHLGKYFMEHPHFVGGHAFMWRGVKTLTWLQEHIPIEGGARGRAVFTTTKRFQEANRSVGFSAELREVPKLDERATPLIKGLIENSYGLTHAGLRPKDVSLWNLWCKTEQVPNPLSRLSLSEQKDVFGKPRIHLNWVLADIDRESVRKSLLAFAKAVGTWSLGRVRLNIAADLKMPTNTLGGAHHIGTTRMGTDEKDGVVDKDLKVFSTENLYVASSSTFRTGGYTNPTLTILALVIRLSEHLQKKIT